MKNFTFKKIDAFATEKSYGNPAGYIRLNSPAEITATEMQQIAKELKGFVNEVGYVYPLRDDAFDLKFYSAEREVDFCGHATIAIMYDLISSEARLKGMDSLKIRTNRGELIVENRLGKENAVFILSPVPQEIMSIPSDKAMAEALRIDIHAINKNLPVKIINAGLNTLLIPITSLEGVISIAPELEELKQFCFAFGIDIIEVFTDRVAGELSDYRTRVFAPTFGYLEDPATGSGNSAFGYYLINHKLWNKETVIIEQNNSLDRYNVVKLQKKEDQNRQERVLFGGGAITRIEGKYIIY